MMPQRSLLATMCLAPQIWIGDQWVLLQMYVHINSIPNKLGILSFTAQTFGCCSELTYV